MQAKQGINSPLSISRQVFSHLQEMRAPSHVTVTWEDKHRNSECPTSSFFPQIYKLAMMPYSMEYPFGLLGSAVPAVSPPTSCAPPAYLLVG